MTCVAIIIFSMVAFSFIYADDKSCGQNEKWDICGRMCEPTCSNRKPNPKTCPRIQCTKSTSACRCKETFYRNSKTKQCVLARKCPRERNKRSHEQYEFPCGDNEQFGHCGRMCEGTCTYPNVTNCADCSNNDCQCKEGYLRHEATDSCVLASMCPRISSLRRSKRAEKCKSGEIMGACGKRCEGTCQHPRTPEICSRIKCNDVSCRCDLASGFVRNTKTKKCVRTSSCPE